jgi:hypothetical protein
MRISFANKYYTINLKLLTKLNWTKKTAPTVNIESSRFGVVCANLEAFNVYKIMNERNDMDAAQRKRTAPTTFLSR